MFHENGIWHAFDDCGLHYTISHTQLQAAGRRTAAGKRPLKTSTFWALQAASYSSFLTTIPMDLAVPITDRQMDSREMYWFPGSLCFIFAIS